LVDIDLATIPVQTWCWRITATTETDMDIFIDPLERVVARFMGAPFRRWTQDHNCCFFFVLFFACLVRDLPGV
jgi:hypothetical protein